MKYGSLLDLSLLLFLIYFVVFNSTDFSEINFCPPSCCDTPCTQFFSTNITLFHNNKTLKVIHHFNNFASSNFPSLWLYLSSTHKHFSVVLGFAGEGPNDNKNKKRKCFCATHNCNGEFINRRLQVKHKKDDEEIKAAGVSYAKTLNDAHSQLHEKLSFVP